jgi:hypothetical protein
MRNKTMGYVIALAIGLFAFAIAGYLLVDMIINANAEEVNLTASVRLNNDNLHTSYQAPPVSVQFEEGAWIAILEDGKMFACKDIYETPRLVKCEIDDAYWYLHDNGIIWGTNSIGKTPQASSDLQALSILLAQ